MHGRNCYTEFCADRYVGSKVEVEEDIRQNGLDDLYIRLLTVVKEAVISVCCVLLYVKFRILRALVLLKRKF